MAKSFEEPEERNTIIDNDSYSPLDTPINEKAYTKANVRLSEADMMNDIPEPKFQPPPIDLSEKKATEQPKKPPIEPLNQEMKDMPKKEQEKSAEHISKIILDAYEMLKNLANKSLLFDERKLRKLSVDGEIDFSIPIPYDHTGRVMPAYEFINEYNSQQKDLLKVTPEFRAEVMPVLTRVLQKRGVGFTDDQMLWYLFGKDASASGMMWYSARSQMKEIIELMKDATAQRAAGNQFPNQARPAQPQTRDETVVYPVAEEPITKANSSQTEEIFEYPEQDINFEAPTVNDEVDAAIQGISVDELQNRKKRGRKPNKDKNQE